MVRIYLGIRRRFVSKGLITAKFTTLPNDLYILMFYTYYDTKFVEHFATLQSHPTSKSCVDEIGRNKNKNVRLPKFFTLRKNVFYFVFELKSRKIHVSFKQTYTFMKSKFHDKLQNTVILITCKISNRLDNFVEELRDT